MRDNEKFLIGATGVAVGGAGLANVLSKKNFGSFMLWLAIAPIYDVCFLDAYFKGMSGFMAVLGVVGAVIINGVMLYLFAHYAGKVIKFMKNLVVGISDFFKGFAH
ncbi:hypothetical protein [Aquitalea pelogenes]|uniref:hypothetical protein n=1 Tax=Aquitalea pelogenes TaxID=1293573 RepID=UPI0035B221C2